MQRAGSEGTERRSDIQRGIRENVDETDMKGGGLGHNSQRAVKSRLGPRFWRVGDC